MQHGTELSNKEHIECEYLIQKHPVFANLSREIISEIAHLFVVLEFHPDDQFIKEDEPIDSIYFIAAGTVLISRTFGSINFMYINELVAGDAIGLSNVGLYSRVARRTATVTAKTDIKLFCLYLNKFNEYLVANPTSQSTIFNNSETYSKVRFISEIMELAKLSAPTILYLASHVKEITAKKGETIFNEGDNGEDCYLLRSGRVEILKNKDGSEKQIAIVEAPTILGESALILSMPRTLTVRAIEDSTFLKISKQDFEKILENNPDVKNLLTERGKKDLESKDNYFYYTKGGWVAHK